MKLIPELEAPFKQYAPLWYQRYLSETDFGNLLEPETIPGRTTLAITDDQYCIVGEFHHFVKGYMHPRMPQYCSGCDDGAMRLWDSIVEQNEYSFNHHLYRWLIHVGNVHSNMPTFREDQMAKIEAELEQWRLLVHEC